MSKVIAETLIKDLSNGPVEFSYTKADGSTRNATGTTKLELIPEADRPATMTEATGDSVPYYDLGSKGWRSFRKDAVVTA